MIVLVRWFLSALTIFVSAYVLQGVEVSNFTAALAAALIWGLVNIIIKPFLFWLSLPINMLSFGLFTFIINIIMIFLSDRFVPGFIVTNMQSALIFGVVLTLMNYVLHEVFE